MSCDDDTFLSAYMDGQLDADQQQLVESALVASPELAENLRALVVVRELVAGLHRDACVDVAPEVMRRIRGLSRSRSRFSSMRPWTGSARRVAAAAGILTLVAGIMLMVKVVVSPRSGDHGHRPTARKLVDNAIAESRSGVSPASTTELGARVVLDSRPSAAAMQTVGSGAADGRPLGGKSENGSALAMSGYSAPGDLELARRMLDNPGERRFFVIKNGADAKAQQQVATVVERTTRFGFFKITVSQGIVIDPRHPDQATVFALLVSPKELGRLRDQLKDVVVPDMIEETPADPGIVTQLADIGHVREFAPVLPADVLISHEAMALRTGVAGAENAAQSSLTSAEKASGRPTPEQYRSAPVAPTGRSGSPSEPERGTAVAAADPVASLPEGAASAGTAHLSEPVSAKTVASSPSELAADAGKPDEMILVFVWICNSRPS